MSIELSQIAISMTWESNLSVNDRYTRGDRPRLRPEVLAWQMELAWELKSTIACMDRDFELGPQVIVDIEMFFPDDGRKRDPDNYLKSPLDAVGAGTGIDDSNFIPFIRSVQTVPELDAGFLIRVYSASFAGHGLTGHIEQQPGPDGNMIIVLDDDLSADWIGTQVTINLGVMRNDRS